MNCFVVLGNWFDVVIPAVFFPEELHLLLGIVQCDLGGSIMVETGSKSVVSNIN
jgi:hypothetical protein